MASLGVNIDHIANVRQARRAVEPDPVSYALLAELGGADGITVHLREDRRHIQDRDVELLRQTVRSRLNLEMAATAEMEAIALHIRPDMVTLVPEKREEVTTEGGLDVAGQQPALSALVGALQDAGIGVSLFVAAGASQLEFAASRAGPAHGGELHRPQPRAEGKCRPWPHLPKRGAHRRHRRHGGAQHRPHNRGPGPGGGPGRSCSADEGADTESAPRPPVRQPPAMSTYHFIAASEAFLTVEEPLEEVLRERVRHYGEQGKEIDFWLVKRPAFLDAPQLEPIGSAVPRPAAAVVSTDEKFITFLKLRLEFVATGRFEAPSTSIPDALASAS